jgi:hypothetical protein
MVRRELRPLASPPVDVITINWPSASSSSTSPGLAWHTPSNSSGVSRRSRESHSGAGLRSSASAGGGGAWAMAGLQPPTQGYRGRAAVPEARGQCPMAITGGAGGEVVPARGTETLPCPLLPRKGCADPWACCARSPGSQALAEPLLIESHELPRNGRTKPIQAVTSKSGKIWIHDILLLLFLHTGAKQLPKHRFQQIRTKPKINP